MDVDKQIRKIQNDNVGSLNAESFIKNLHKKRNQNIMRSSQRISALGSLCVIALFGFFTVTQLANDPGSYASIDLTEYKEMDDETESYVLDLADYLLDSSNDIWETLAFFDEINFDNIIASNYGDVNE